MMAEALSNHGKSNCHEDTKVSPRGESGFIQPSTLNLINPRPEPSKLANLYGRLQIGEQNPRPAPEPEQTVDLANESFCVGKYDYPSETADPLTRYKRTLEIPERRNSADSTDSMNSEATTIRCDFGLGTSPNGNADTTQPASVSHANEATRTISPLRTALALRKASRISKPEAYSKREKWRRLFAKLKNRGQLKLE
ncbi:hypothetical protein BBP40_008225 [Aspergillus hancockii]|nr:hypothetical protein BBP40_008225 [Aspergillus hancockii]